MAPQDIAGPINFAYQPPAGEAARYYAVDFEFLAENSLSNQIAVPAIRLT